jgi:hypothetical protein
MAPALSYRNRYGKCQNTLWYVWATAWNLPYKATWKCNKSECGYNVTSPPWSPNHLCQRLSINHVTLADKTYVYGRELPQGTIHSITCLLKRTKNNCESTIFMCLWLSVILLISGGKSIPQSESCLRVCVLTNRPASQTDMNVLKWRSPVRHIPSFSPCFEQFHCQCRTFYVRTTTTTFNIVS